VPGPVELHRFGHGRHHSDLLGRPFTTRSYVEVPRDRPSHVTRVNAACPRASPDNHEDPVIAGLIRRRHAHDGPSALYSGVRIAQDCTYVRHDFHVPTGFWTLAGRSWQ
jgi:hypothetical protein